MRKAAALIVMLAFGAAAAVAVAQPAEIRQALPQARQIGQGNLTFLGFQVYGATLWAAPGFNATDFTAQPFVLELAYQRDFAAEAIAARSIKEMRRAGSFSDAQAAQWQKALQDAFPDVKRGDRIAGVYRPEGAAAFLTNGKPTGEIRDAEFARLFFGIWLGPQTSEPALRRALLGLPVQP